MAKASKGGLGKVWAGLVLAALAAAPASAFAFDGATLTRVQPATGWTR
jgi:hypothetical protein